MRLFLYANYYYNLGFSITHVIPRINSNRGQVGNPFKAPTNDTRKLANKRQELSEIINFNWNDSVGIGTILGFNTLRALDFDGCNNDNFIKNILGKIGLPENYEWVVRTGSKNGFHILFQAENHRFIVEEGKTKAFTPNSLNKNKFSVLELRWEKHLILPPSISKDFNEYKFINCELPSFKPKHVPINLIENLVFDICVESDGTPNKVKSNIQHYYEHEFLDFAPPKLKIGTLESEQNHHDFEINSHNYFKNAINHIVNGNFSSAYSELKLGFDTCSCDCRLVTLINNSHTEIIYSLQSAEINCKGYEYDFIRAVIFYFIDSAHLNESNKVIYLKALALIESFMSLFPKEEIGHYIKGRILAGLEKFEEAIEIFFHSLELRETPRSYYRIGRIKEDKLNQLGIGYLYKSILMYPSSICCIKWLKEISAKRNIKLSYNTHEFSPNVYRTILSFCFSNLSTKDYLIVLNHLKKNGKLIFNTGETISISEAFEEFANQIKIDRAIFLEEDQIENNNSTTNQEKTINKLSKNIAKILGDYRSDEHIEEVLVNETGITNWINQFDKSTRVPILEEIDRIMNIRYCSKEKMISFLSNSISQLHERSGCQENIKSFLSGVSFLNLQPPGKSQGIILNLLNELLKEQYNLTLNDCGSGEIKFYVYLDDILCTGLTLISNIIDWSKLSDRNKNKHKNIIETSQAKLIIAYAFLHTRNYHKKITEMRLKISKEFSENCELICLTEIDNTLEDCARVDLIFPIENSSKKQSLYGDQVDDKITQYKDKVIKIVDKHNEQYGIVSQEEFYRPKHLPQKETLFKNEENRQIIEKAFLEKGIDILENVRLPNKNIRPLGYSIPSVKNFGFGALCFTWRNVPNNAPLVFWYSHGGFTPLFKVTRGNSTKKQTSISDTAINFTT